MSVHVVTGFVPIPGNPRSIAEYEKLGAQWVDVTAAPVTIFRERLNDCWVMREGFGHFEAAPGDNPAKNSVAYHAVMHQKSEWMVQAMRSVLDPDGIERSTNSTTIVWIDYGIFHIPGVTPAVINSFLQCLERPERLTIAGRWADADLSDANPCWRFLGGLVVAPAGPAVYNFHSHCWAALHSHLIRDHGKLWWEVNTWTLAERRGMDVQWYEADHDASIFTNYPHNIEDWRVSLPCSKEHLFDSGLPCSVTWYPTMDESGIRFLQCGVHGGVCGQIAP